MPIFRQTLTVAISLLASLLSVSAATGQAMEPDSSGIGILAERVRSFADSAGVPGGAVVVVSEGRVVLVEPFGIATPQTGAVDAETVFRVASVSKVFTAKAVASLVSEGRVSLDSDLRDRFPWLRDAASGAEPVTLTQLLTHTSGFDDRSVGMFSPTAEGVRPLGEYLADRMPPRTTEPGRWTRYNNHGAALAGLVVEKASGQAFAEAVNSLVLEPLGMQLSSFEQPISEALVSRMARAYPCPLADCEPLPLDYRHTLPAGALVTSASDMGRFMTALVGSSESLDAPTKTLLFSQHWTHREEIPGMALAFMEQDLGQYRALVHAGNSSGYSSLLALVPETSSGLFLVTSGGSSRFGAAVLDSYVELVLSNSEELGMDADEIPIPLSVSEAAEYQGSYLLARAPRGSYESFPARFLFSQSVLFDDDGYLLRREGGVSRQYGVVGRDLFLSLDGIGRLAFERDESGKVVAMHAADVFNGARTPGSYEKLSWWETPGFTNELLSWILGIPVLSLLAWTIFAIGRLLFIRFIRGKGSATVSSISAPVFVTGFLLALSTTLLMGIFLLGFIARFNALAFQAPVELAYGLPDQLSRLLWMPWAVLSSTAGLVIFTALAWKDRNGSVWDRLVLLAVAASSVVFVAQLVCFKLLPPVS